MILHADWDAPARVTAFTTLRTGGVSLSPYDSFNLAAHVGDDAGAVSQNRRILAQSRGWDGEPLWLNQVHGSTVVQAETIAPGQTPTADGAVTFEPGLTLAILTADCLPVVACDTAGTVIGAFHAGWKGLLAGVIENGLSAMESSPRDLLVWIGPAIGAASYQVGPEVREAYVKADPAHEADFADDGPGHWRFNLAAAAERRIRKAGVTQVSGGRWDTFADTDLFFSHRRAAPCGRMATVIRIERKA
jgi:YfiH family protein